MKIVFFTGAGVSKESGLDTFRDKGGIWDQYDPEEVCSLRGYNKNRKAVLDFHNAVRAAVDLAQPNDAHKAIAQLEAEHDVWVVTQNIDDLHERAGSTKVVKVHGSIHTAKLKRYKSPTIPWTEDITSESHPEGWIQSKGSLRHDVVFFGEQVKKAKLAVELIKHCDVLVVVGTSLEVMPAAGWIKHSCAFTKVLVDPNPKTAEFYFTDVIAKPASSGIQEVIEIIRNIK